MKVTANVDFIWNSYYEGSDQFCIPRKGMKLVIAKRSDGTWDGFMYAGCELISWTKRIEEEQQIRSIMEGKFEKWMQGKYDCI
jgi:hypothetical protein